MKTHEHLFLAEVQTHEHSLKICLLPDSKSYKFMKIHEHLFLANSISWKFMTTRLAHNWNSWKFVSVRILAKFKFMTIHDYWFRAEWEFMKTHMRLCLGEILIHEKSWADSHAPPPGRMPGWPTCINKLVVIVTPSTATKLHQCSNCSTHLRKVTSAQQQQMRIAKSES